MTAPDARSEIPADVAAELLRVLVPALRDRVRRDGLTLSGRTVAYLHTLHAAAEQGSARAPRADVGSEDPQSGSVDLTVREAAALMGCRPRWIRTLLESGRLRGRRVNTRMWLVDRDSFDAYRTGQVPCPTLSPPPAPRPTPL